MVSTQPRRIVARVDDRGACRVVGEIMRGQTPFCRIHILGLGEEISQTDIVFFTANGRSGELFGSHWLRQGGRAKLLLPEGSSWALGAHTLVAINPKVDCEDPPKGFRVACQQFIRRHFPVWLPPQASA